MAMLNHWSNFILLQPAQRPALPAWGGRVESPSKRDSTEARNMPKNAAPTTSRVHALLGGVIPFKNPFIQADLGLEEC